MAENLNTEIKKALENILAKYQTLTHQELTIQLETVYEKALLAEFLTERALRREELHKQIISKHAREESLPVNEATPTEFQEAALPTDDIAEQTINLTPEIKVVPHPDGPPPMPRDLEETPEPPAIEEQPETNKQEVKTKKAKGTEKTIEKKAPTSIAERAQVENKKKSLHTQLASKGLKFGLNDRLAYVKHLFEGNTDDFNRVVSQINTLESWDEANDFIENMIKPDYNWEEKAEFEERFVAQVKTKFE